MHRLLVMAGSFVVFLCFVQVRVARADDPWAVYDQAFAEEAAGHDEAALALFERVVHDFPKTPVASYSEEMIRLMRARRSGMVPPPDQSIRLTPPLQPPMGLAARLRSETPTSLARAELVSFQTVNGIALAVEVTQIAQVTDARVIALAAVGGGGAGLALSLVLTRDGVTPGFADALDSGTLWGAYNGGLIAAAIPTLSTSSLFGLIAAGQLAGLGLGYGAATLFHPAAGDVSLANSGGLWTGALAMLLALSINSNASGQAMAITALVSVDVGLIAGSLLARRFPVSRGRVLLIDSGGVLGGLVGAAIVAIVTDGKAGATPFALASAGGIVAGLATGVFLTRHWDAPETPPVSVSFMPTPTGGAGLMVAYRF